MAFAQGNYEIPLKLKNDYDKNITLKVDAVSSGSKRCWNTSDNDVMFIQAGKQIKVDNLKFKCGEKDSSITWDVYASTATGSIISDAVKAAEKVQIGVIVLTVKKDNGEERGCGGFESCPWYSDVTFNGKWGRFSAGKDIKVALPNNETFEEIHDKELKNEGPLKFVFEKLGEGEKPSGPDINVTVPD